MGGVFTIFRHVSLPIAAFIAHPRYLSPSQGLYGWLKLIRWGGSDLFLQIVPLKSRIIDLLNILSIYGIRRGGRRWWWGWARHGARGSPSRILAGFLGLQGAVQQTDLPRVICFMFATSSDFKGSKACQVHSHRQPERLRHCPVFPPCVWPLQRYGATVDPIRWPLPVYSLMAQIWTWEHCVKYLEWNLSSKCSEWGGRGEANKFYGNCLIHKFCHNYTYCNQCRVAIQRCGTAPSRSSRRWSIAPKWVSFFILFDTSYCFDRKYGSMIGIKSTPSTEPTGPCWPCTSRRNAAAGPPLGRPHWRSSSCRCRDHCEGGQTP